MKRQLAAFVIATLVPFCAAAAPASEESVLHLLDLMNAHAVVEQSYDRVEKMMRSVALQSVDHPLSAAETRALDTVVSKSMALMRQEMTWGKLLPLYVKLYQKTFDQDELDGLVQFYSSPAGQAFVRKMPLIIQGSLEISQTLMQGLMPRMMEIVKESMTKG